MATVSHLSIIARRIISRECVPFRQGMVKNWFFNLPEQGTFPIPPSVMNTN
jgi:hypothetical protein